MVQKYHLFVAGPYGVSHEVFHKIKDVRKFAKEQEESDNMIIACIFGNSKKWKE